MAQSCNSIKHKTDYDAAIGNNVAQTPVWDRFVRLFHWSLVTCFITAYFSAQVHAKEIHVITGYLICALMLTRLVWGFVGSRYARFAQFLYSPAQTIAYIRSLRTARPIHYRGHNPLGALMVFALLLVLLALITSGLLILGGIEFEGPFLFLALRCEDGFFYAARDAHEVLVNLALLMVAAHVGGVVISSRQHHENLVRSMITGSKTMVAAVDAAD